MNNDPGFCRSNSKMVLSSAASDWHANMTGRFPVAVVDTDTAALYDCSRNCRLSNGNDEPAEAAVCKGKAPLSSGIWSVFCVGIDQKLQYVQGSDRASGSMNRKFSSIHMVLRENGVWIFGDQMLKQSEGIRTAQFSNR